MNCSFWAMAGAANAALASAAAPANRKSLVFIIDLPRNDRTPGAHRRSSCVEVFASKLLPTGHAAMERDSGSIRERPQPELFFRDRPQPGEPVRLDDQEEHDQGAEQHELDVRDRRRR